MRNLLAAIMVLLCAGIAQADAPDAVTLLLDKLQAGKTAEAEQQLEAFVALHPADQNARYALGAAQFVLAIEHLGQSLYRHGLERPNDYGIGPQLPFLRFPLPRNPAPEKLTYADARAMLQAFVDDLAKADASLSAVEDPAAALPVNIGLIRMDFNRDGAAGDDETLWKVFASVSSLPIDEAQARQFMIRFDAGDAAWMRGYSHLMRAMAEFLLAHDWQQDFDYTFHRFFPGAQLPYAALDEGLNRRISQWRQYQECIGKGDRALCERMFPVVPDFYDGDFFNEIADFVTLIHLMHWPVKEPARMARVLHHLEQVVAMSRLSWKHILAETDDNREWIPNPVQTGVLRGMVVTQAVVDGWLGFMEQFDALLQGKLLIGHWRLDKGINLRRVFLEPRDFDPVLWAQGSAALPYLEDGPQATGDTWMRLEQLFGGNFFRYAVWLN